MVEAKVNDHSARVEEFLGFGATDIIHNALRRFSLVLENLLDINALRLKAEQIVRDKFQVPLEAPDGGGG